MNTFKKIKNLLIIILFVSGNSKAQQSITNTTITITNFNVYENNDQLIIDWETKGVADVNYWQIQNSTDGQRYATIALVFGPDPRQKGNRFQYKGKLKNATGGKTFYRLNPVDHEEKEINTEIIQPAK